MDSELEELGAGVIWLAGIVVAAVLSLGGAFIVGWQ
jgi:hypothetical protein